MSRGSLLIFLGRVVLLVNSVSAFCAHILCSLFHACYHTLFILMHVFYVVHKVDKKREIVEFHFVNLGVYWVSSWSLIWLRFLAHVFLYWLSVSLS